MNRKLNELRTGDRISAIAVQLTKIRSIVGTEGEVAVARWIYDHLSRLDYFRAHPDCLRLIPVRNDSLGRLSVFAWVRGTKSPSARTVLCLGHIDTVGIGDFADLQKYATDPNKLKTQLPSVKFSAETLSEIESDNWLVGRGILDMKTGIAAHIVMIEEFSRSIDQWEGNLLFTAVPDEENTSSGMLSIVKDLAEMKNSYDFQFVAAVDTDYTSARYPGDSNRYVYVGTTGKLLPCFYVYGEETHVGEPFGGLDANLLASEILVQIDMNTGLCDAAEGEVALPPISLGQRDLKTEYSVQTVNAVSLYFNYATHNRLPEEVLLICKAQAEAAFSHVIHRLNNEYEKFCNQNRIPYVKLPWEASVLTYAELYQEVKREMGDEIDRIITQKSWELIEKQATDQAFSLALVQEVHKHYSDQNSKVIVYFAPPYYPHINVKSEDPNGAALLNAVSRAVEDARSFFDYPIVIRNFYPYISDLSYCSIPRQENFARLTDNMPAWRRRYTLPVDEIESVSMPVVNIGPYGKDAHKISERVCKDYSLDAMPFILRRTLENLLNVSR